MKVPFAAVPPGRHASVWISWNRSRRSINLASALKIPLVARQIEAPPLVRHPASACWTVVSLARIRPRTIFLQHSFLLAIIVAAYKRLMPWRVVVVNDCHTKAFRRDVNGPAARLFRRLRGWSFSCCDTVIVASEEMVPEVEKLGWPFLVMPDLIIAEPEPSAGNRSTEEGPPCVTAVCSFSEDEPVAELLDAMAMLPEIEFAVTGRPPKRFQRALSAPNVRLTGFLPSPQYRTLLERSSCIVVLTTDEGCFLCGAGEALALTKPLVTSDTRALRSFFGDSAVYVEPEPVSIARGVAEALENADTLVMKASRLKRAVAASQESALRVLQELATAGRVDGARQSTSRGITARSDAAGPLTPPGTEAPSPRRNHVEAARTPGLRR